MKLSDLRRTVDKLTSSVNTCINFHLRGLYGRTNPLSVRIPFRFNPPDGRRFFSVADNVVRIPAAVPPDSPLPLRRGRARCGENVASCTHAVRRRSVGRRAVT
jgi:hypothetical protein